MDAAGKYENRHRAVIEYANGAMLNVAELDVWATENKIPVSFWRLLRPAERGDDCALEQVYVSVGILADMIAWGAVPEDNDPDDARLQLRAAGDTAETDDPVSRLRDLVMVHYDRQLLTAAYDGDLFLYDTLTMSRIDLSAAKVHYDANPEAYLEVHQARLAGATRNAVTTADIKQAKETLARKFARLDHIAWAMVILTSEAPAQGEGRYRQILGVTRWLESLALQFRTSNGLPASQPKGVPVAGTDVRDYRYLAIADVRTAAIEAHCWPAKVPDSPPSPDNPHETRDRADIKKHAIVTRSNSLKAVINKAKTLAEDPSDAHSIWAALVELATGDNRPAPLIGYADSEGIKWEDNGTVKFLSKKNFADRLRRAKAR